jgi:hypothetical protein
MQYTPLFLFILISYFTLGFSEIQKVVVTWDPVPCQQSCIEGLRKRFSMIAGVQSVDMNQASGLATLTWKPNVSFSFVPINNALRWIGIREIQVRVQATGKISQKGSDFYLVSSNDGTRFLLLNRVAQTGNTYIEEYNAENRGLSPELVNQLTDIMKNQQLATVEGPLFMPERSPPDPLSLVINTVKAEEKTETKKTSTFK